MRLFPRLFLISAALALSAPVGAFDVNEVRARYTITSWTEKDGMPSSYIRAIDQDHDGYLWLATYSGLVRFDGERFVTWKAHDGVALPSDDLSGLLVAHDGSLWVGGLGSVTHIVDGRIASHKPPAEGLFDGYVSVFLEDNAGTIWAAGQDGVARFDGTQWEKVGAQQGLPERPAISLHQDNHGVLWVGTSVGAYHRIASTGIFEAVGSPSLSYAIENIAQDSSGDIVLTHPTHLITDLGGPGTDRNDSEMNRSHGTKLLRDREGSLWVGTRSQGIVRIRGEHGIRGRVIERVTREDGLSADSVLALFEDREGNIWVGTPFGLNRLSENAIIPVPMGQGMTGHVRAVTAAEDGSIWAATDESLLHFSGTEQTRYDWGSRLPTRTIVALHRDPQTATLWISTNEGLVRFAAGRFAPFVMPGGLELNRVRSIGTDKDGHLWLCDADRGVFRSTDRTLTSFDLIVANKPAATVYAARDGRVWIGLVNGTVRSYQNGKLQSFAEGDGLPAGSTISTIHEDRAGTIWIGTHRGLSRFDNGRFVTLDSANGFPGTGPVAIEDDEDGYLWLGVTGLGVLRVSQKEFDRAVVDRAHKIQYRLYGASDGLRATPVRQFGTPASAHGVGDQIWFLTGNGLAVVDPNRLRGSRPSVPLLVEDMLADNEGYGPLPELKLPPHTSKFQINYTLLSLAPLSQVSFRYKLEGFDEQWIDAGPRRQAFYTNVPPGHYRFRVEADRDGAPTSAAAAWSFSVEPRFYQTSWFALACAVLGALGLWGLWQLRLQQIRRRFAVVLDERARMGREIHDTLLQGLVGVAVQFKVIAEHLHSSPDAAKERLERLRKLVEHYICETRQSIWDLRSPTLEATDLVTALRQAGETITADKNVQFELAVTGKPYPCDPKVEEQLLRVGREALSNAVRHADPNRVRVDLVYTHDVVRLRVTDDGSGFSPDDPGFNAGTHWGLTSMRERAQQINAQFQLASTPGKGTELELIVPATAR
jgi:signal transduction histidine kinase/ligand-binding sensor domain-containing protein